MSTLPAVCRCAVRIGLVVQIEVEVRIDGLWLFTLVGHHYLEAGRFSEGNTTHALLVEVDNGVLNLLRAGIEHRTGIIEHGGTLVLPGALGGTAEGAVDETSLMSGLIILQVTLVTEYLAEDSFVEHVEIVVHKDVVPADRLIFRRDGISIVDIEVQVTPGVHRNVEALFAGIVVRSGIMGHDIDVTDRKEMETPIYSSYLDLCEVFIFIAFFLGTLTQPVHQSLEKHRTEVLGAC